MKQFFIFLYATNGGNPVSPVWWGNTVPFAVRFYICSNFPNDSKLMRAFTRDAMVLVVLCWQCQTLVSSPIDVLFSIGFLVAIFWNQFRSLSPRSVVAVVAILISICPTHSKRLCSRRGRQESVGQIPGCIFQRLNLDVFVWYDSYTIVSIYSPRWESES